MRSRVYKMASRRSAWILVALTTATMLLDGTECIWQIPFNSLFPAPNPEFQMTTMEMAEKYGYPVEKHVVTTNDGYVLEMHRIPQARLEPQRRGGHNTNYLKGDATGRNRPVVLLQHGAGSSSLQWLMLGPDQGLGFVLASLGYDVWMPNSRGNVYSRGHVTLDASDERGPFWNFSWQEMAEFDSPAQIDYILAATGETSLLGVGYSQGATQLLALLSERTEYNDKFRVLLLMAPLVFSTAPPITYKLLVAVTKDTRWAEQFVEVREEKAGTREQIDLASRLCGDGSITQALCAQWWCAQASFDCAQLNVTQLPGVIGHFEGGSTKQRLHYLQLLYSGKFRKYDYRAAGNMAVYGRSSPPSYNVTKVRVPTSIHYCAADSFTDIQDIDLLHARLANPVGKYLVPLHGFSHSGFIIAKNVKQLVYNQLAAILQLY